MESVFKSLVVIYTLCFISVPFYGQETPCTGDVAKFCANVSTGMQGIMNCLREHQDELSVLCRAATQATIQVTEACKLDIVRHCGKIKPGGGRIMKCLKDNEAKLSPECKKIQAKGKSGEE